MRILFTGASSFSGLWFAKELVHAGHEVTATFKRPLEAYTGIRRQRVDSLLPHCQAHFDISFGDDNFIKLIREEGPWDLLCNHAAEVTDYRSPNFDFATALATNTKNLKEVLVALQQTGCQKILLTGSVFEPHEGAGSDGLRAVSPYGLSKGLTTESFAYYTAMMNMSLGKFVIPNPFGAYEEGRFTNYLAQSWLSGKSASVNTPLYVRDNVPVDLLAKAYAQFAAKLPSTPGLHKFNPSYYAESQGDFTRRFANEMQLRLNVPCNFELKSQADFPEPKTRINTERLDPKLLNWNESQFWDQCADYYNKLHPIPSLTVR